MENNTRNQSAGEGFLHKLQSLDVELQTFLLIGLFLLLGIFFSVMEERFLTMRSVTSMGFQLAEIGLLSLAMMLTILVGGINLSVVAISNLAAVITGFFFIHLVPEQATSGQAILFIFFGVLVAIFVGLLCGILNGFLIGFIGIDSILATLATLSLFMGVSTGVTGGETVTGFPDQLAFIGSEKIFGVPVPFLIFVLLTGLASLILYQTSFGFKVRMLGSNPVASRFSGIDNPGIVMKVHILSAIYASLAGVIIMSRTMSAAYEYGRSYLILTLLIAVLGGIIPGFGNVIDIFFSVLIIQVLSTGFHMLLRGMQGSAFFKDFSYGVLLVVVLIIRFLTREQQSRG